jgi:cell division septation protein DedD
MKIGTMFITAGVLALGLAAWNTPSKAQGPLYDRVNVNLPYAVTVGNRTLQPGDYVIQQLRDQSGNSRVLLIYSDNGMKFETSAMTIPALDNNTPENTKVILNHFGNDYYFDKIWIQGKDYGYEFPVPDSVKSRQNERMEPVSVAATYSTTQSTDTTTATDTTTSAATNSKTTTPAAQNPTTNTTTAQSETTQTPTTTTNTMTAQNQTTTQPATVPSTTQGQSTMQPSTTQSRNTMPSSTMGSTNDNSSANRSMPNTSAGWLMMLLSGGALSSAGLALRKR